MAIMGKLRSSSFLLPAVMFFLTTYLFCCLTNAFFVPRSLPLLTNRSLFTGFHHRRNSFESTNRVVNFIALDKYILNESQIDSIKLNPFFVVIFSPWMLFIIELILYPLKEFRFLNKQQSYLFYSTFRIWKLKFLIKTGDFLTSAKAWFEKLEHETAFFLLIKNH